MKKKKNYFPLFRRILQSGIPKTILIALYKALMEKYDIHYFSLESFIFHFQGAQLWVNLPASLRIQYHTGSPRPYLNTLSFDYESVFFCICFNADFSYFKVMTFVGIGLNGVPRGKGGFYVQKRKRKKIAKLKH